MDYILQWQQLSYLWLLPICLIVAWYRATKYKHTRYRYTLVSALKRQRKTLTHPYKKVLYLMRFIALVLLALCIAQPRVVDPASKLPVEGIDIVMVLDVSGSMEMQDEERDARTRIQVAKDEAIRFVDKRHNDAIGLVLFANDAFSRVPVTMDKQMLKKVIDDIQLGVINPNGTLLFTGVLTAANRLKQSKAKSKVMILLTDGEPSDGDMKPEVVMDIVKALGIKVYAVGIGSDHMRYIQHPLGILPVPGVNKQVLTYIAQTTGGHFFLAKNPSDMRAIYDTIDALETSEQEIPHYGRWYDLVWYFLPFVYGMILLAIILSTFVWFSI